MTGGRWDELLRSNESCHVRIREVITAHFCPSWIVVLFHPFTLQGVNLQHQSRLDVPSDMAMEWEDTRIVDNESQYGKSERSNIHCIPERWVCEVQSIRVTLIEVGIEGTFVSICQNPELVTVQVEWMGTVIEIID